MEYIRIVSERALGDGSVDINQEKALIVGVVIVVVVIVGMILFRDRH